MQKILLALVVIVSAIPNWAQSEADSNAREPKSVTFVGRYGEVLEFPKGFSPHPELHGEVEVVNYYPDYILGTIEPFRPKPKDIVPENFSRLYLTQLVAMPWSSSQAKSLLDLKEAKRQDLVRAGAEFKIDDEPPYRGSFYARWPEGSFEVLIEKPYRLTQLYTGTSTHLFILSGGLDSPQASVMSMVYEPVRSSLAHWIAPPDAANREGERRVIERAPYFGAYRSDVLAIWLILFFLPLILAWTLDKKGRFSNLRRILTAWSVLGASGAVAGFVIGLIFRPFEWSLAHKTLPSALTVLLLPIFYSRLGVLREKRAGRSALLAWCVFSFAVLAGLSLYSTPNPWDVRYIPIDTAFRGFFVFAIGGLVAETIASIPGLLAVAFALSLSTESSAQSSSVRVDKNTPNAIAADPLTMARENLRKQGITQNFFAREARANVSKSRIVYDYQRVEVKGIFSKDDTEDTFPKLFDKHIEPSHIGEGADRVVKAPALARPFLNGLKDLMELRGDAYQNTSKRADQVARELEGKEINEIVAHSWGTEIVYNGILSGKILPPRRLIIAGMPDRDMEKWVLLSKYTGTEVVAYADSHDPAARAARIGGALPEALESPADHLKHEEIEKRYLNNPVTDEFEARWVAACAKRNCNPRSRQPPEPVFNYDYKGPTHNRLKYYKAMLDDGTIPFDRSDATKLAADQQALIDTESKRLFEAAYEKEVSRLKEIAKRQSEKTAKDHDERVREKIIAVMRMACADPSSISQSDLDALPKPINDHFFFRNADSRYDSIPSGLEKCWMLYHTIGGMVERRERLTVDLFAPPPDLPSALHQPSIFEQSLRATIPNPGAATLSMSKPLLFVSKLPEVRDLAVSACRSAGSGDIERSLSRLRVQYTFMRAAEDDAARRLAGGLGACESTTFYKLIERIRAQDGSGIEAQWLLDFATVSRPVSQPVAQPSSDGTIYWTDPTTGIRARSDH